MTYPPVTTFAPEHFAVARVADTSKYKQFRKGIDTLAGEGVVQVLVSERRGDGSPVFAVVGPMQFEVASHRMEHEFGARISLDSLPYSLAMRTDEASVAGHHVQQRHRGHEAGGRGTARPLHHQVGHGHGPGEAGRDPRAPGGRAALSRPAQVSRSGRVVRPRSTHRPFRRSSAGGGVSVGRSAPATREKGRVTSAPSSSRPRALSAKVSVT